MPGSLKQSTQESLKQSTQESPKQMSQNAMPELKTSFDINYIKENIKIIETKIKQIKLLGKTDAFDFELEIMSELPEFYQSHPFLVKKLCKGDDISLLYTMFENLQQVEHNTKSLHEVETTLGNKLAKDFILPMINKK